MLKLIFWIVALLLALSYFGISISGIVHSPTGQDNFGYLLSLFQIGWEWLKGFFLGIYSFITGLF